MKKLLSCIALGSAALLSACGDSDEDMTGSDSKVKPIEVASTPFSIENNEIEMGQAPAGEMAYQNGRPEAGSIDAQQRQQMTPTS